MPPGGGKAGVAAGEGLTYGHVTQDDDPLRGAGVVQRGALNDVTAPVVPYGMEPVVAEGGHETHKIRRHGPLAGLGVVGSVRRNGGSAVAAKVGADDAETSVDEPWSDGVPSGMRARVTMDQEHRWSVTAVANSQADLPHLEVVQGEPVLPGPASSCRGHHRLRPSVADPLPATCPAVAGLVPSVL